jgi:hypothetical protein
MSLKWTSFQAGLSLTYVVINNSHDSSVGIALGYGLDDQGSRVRFPAGAGIFLYITSLRLEQLWGPPILLSNGYQELFPWG